MSVRLQNEPFTRLLFGSVDELFLTVMDKQMHTGMISADLQTAFDTLDHGVLLKKKKKYYGFWTSVIKWFESYISNRKLLVCINNIFF